VKRDPLLVAATFLGAGMGGFADGIVLHQLLQLHGTVSGQTPKTTLVGAQVNMFWDGAFHVFTWTMVAIGLRLFWEASKRRGVWEGRTLVGGMLLGWGVFNVVEGLVDHHLLHLHHVVESLGPSVWDWAFLASGFALIGAGTVLLRQRTGTPSSSPTVAARR
jgi:uncharacterized membrane protein